MLTLSCSSSTLNAFLADLKKKNKHTHFSLTLDYQVLFIFDLNIHHSPCLLNIHLFFFVPLIHISVAIEIRLKKKQKPTKQPTIQTYCFFLLQQNSFSSYTHPSMHRGEWNNFKLTLLWNKKIVLWKVIKSENVMIQQESSGYHLNYKHFKQMKFRVQF